MKTSQAVIIVLLAANLFATVWFGLKDDPCPAPTQMEKAAAHDLPPSITEDVRDQILREFVEAFNAADFDALYEMFGPAAKAQLSREDSDKEFKKLVKYFHSIEDGAYGYSEFLSTQGNTNIYQMHYAMKLSERSDFGTNGTLKVTLAVQGSNYQIYGIRLNAG